MSSENMNYSKKTKRGYFLILGIIATVFTAGCNLKPPALGEHNQIVVLADDEVWSTAGAALKEVFERTVVTPQHEKTYVLTRPALDGSQIYRKYHNLVLLGTLNSDGIIGELLNNVITGDKKTGVESGQKYVFQQRDIWASNQYMLIIVAPTIQELIEKLSENSDRLYNLVDVQVNKLVKEEMYKMMEQVEISKKIFDDYDFTVRVQHDYMLKEFPEQNAILLRRMAPDRLLMIHWVDTTEVDYLPAEWAIAKRRELSGTIFDGRMMDSKSLITKRTTFADYTAWEVSGLWYHPEDFVGGPMQMYTFFDDRTNRIYMLDLALFAPHLIGEKVPFIRQLRVMAETFTTNPRNRPK